MKPTASVKTLSEKFDIKPRTIRQWMTERKFTWYKPAKIVLIDVESFEGFLSRKTVEPPIRDLAKKVTIDSYLT